MPGPRLRLLFLLCVLVVLGLASRQVPFLPAQTGDALWAMTLYCFLRLLFPQQGVGRMAFVSLCLAFLVEFQQLLRWPWLVSLRSTWLGHMCLGQGFLWTDLIAYTLGILLLYLFFTLTTDS